MYMRGLLYVFAGIVVSALIAVFVLRRSPVPDHAAPDSPPSWHTSPAPVHPEPQAREPAPSPPAPAPPPPARVVAVPAPAPAPEPTSPAAPVEAAPSAEGAIRNIGVPSRAIVAFDPRLWDALRGGNNRMAYLSYAAPVRKCARDFMARHQYATWSFGGIARVRADIAGGVVRFGSVEITDFSPSGMPDRPPDQQFVECYARAIQSMSIRCPECKDGSIEFAWKLKNWDYRPGDDGFGGAPDPNQDTGFVLESPGI